MTIFIPTPLRAFTANKDAVEVNAATIAGALDELTAAYPDLRKHLFTSEGNSRADDARTASTTFAPGVAAWSFRVTVAVSSI